MPEGPNTHTFSSALRELFSAGAILQSMGQTAPLSLLGRLATELNVDLKYTRLVYFGWLSRTALALAVMF